MSKPYSIIVPTFNSDRWIKPCINSVLAQTYPDFDIIILDSGSTDGTLQWIASIGDSRIKIFPAEKRLGIVENWARITSIPKNEFLTILGHDDILYPNYLETIEALRIQYPDAGLYQTHFNCIDENGKHIRACVPMTEKIRPLELLQHILENSIDIVATGFMIRSSTYDALGGIPPYPNLLYADTSLWLSAIKHNYLAVSPAACFEFRFHLANTSKSAGVLRLTAFEMMIGFLVQLKKENEAYRLLIEKLAPAFMKSYVTGACHKLLYVPKQNRGSVTIESIIISAKKCAAELMPGSVFEPEKFPSIRLAKLIDSNPLLRKLFLFYKSFSGRTF